MPYNTETLDKLLTESLKNNIPASGLHLFGINQLEEEDMMTSKSKGQTSGNQPWVDSTLLVSASSQPVLKPRWFLPCSSSLGDDSFTG